MTEEPDIHLDLENPEDARRFIKEALPKAFPEDFPNITHAWLTDGTKIDLNDLTDSQAVQYAYELLPMYEAAFPELVQKVYEQ